MNLLGLEMHGIETSQGHVGTRKAEPDCEQAVRLSLCMPV